MSSKSKAKNKSAAAAAASSSPPPLLILHPDNVMGMDGHALYREPLVKPRLKPYVEIDATSENGDVEDVKRHILSGKYPVILVCDLSENVQWFTSKFRSCLRSFVHAGGIVAFPTCEGVHLCIYALRPIFGLQWDRGDYRRSDIIKSATPLTSQWCPKAPSRMNVKGVSLKNVSASERLYSPVNSTEAACAIAQYGRGFIAYFGDVNQEDETIQLIFEVLQSARRKAIVLPKPIGELSVKEPPLKAWCDGWCLEARQRGKPQYGGIGFYFDEDSGFGSYHGPIEDNGHPSISSLESASLQAAINALLVAKSHERNSVLLHSDSQFLQDSVTKLSIMWHNYGWRQPSDGLPPPNLKWQKMLYELQEIMDVEWRWISRAANDRSNRLAQLGTEVFLNDPAAPSHRVDAIKQTLAKARRAGWRLCPLINQRRVSVAGMKRVQVKCSVPKDDGKLKSIYCLSSLDAYGLVKVNACFVSNVGHARIFRVPVSNKAWDRMDFGRGGDSCHLVLPPGCVVGVGIIDGNPEAFGELKFNKIEFMSTEGQTGPLEDSLDDDVEAEKFAIDLTEDDDMDEEDTFEEFTYINPQMLNLFTNSMNMA